MTRYATADDLLDVTSFLGWQKSMNTRNQFWLSGLAVGRKVCVREK